MNDRKDVPRGLKPSSVQVRFGTAEAVPFVQQLLPQSLQPISPKHWVAFAALGVVWGTSWIATETLAEYVSPLRGAAVRFLLAAVLCTPVVLWKRVRLPRGRALGFVLLLSVTMIVLPSLLLLWAQSHVRSATVVVLFAAMPLLLALSSPGVPSRALQATIVAVGAIALAAGASFSAAQAGGAAVALLAVACTAASLLIARREFVSTNPIGVTVLLLGAAAALLFLASLVLERGQTSQWNRNAIGSVVFLAVVAGAPAYACYFWLLQQLEAYKVATVQWIEPLVAIIESAFFLRVPLSFSMVAGSVVTLASLLLVVRARTEDDNTVSLLGNS
jgi:drug/metabolite transporter (DMT)-like permease